MASDELPRTALERVLARASELQMTEQREPGDGISEARLLDIAKEVGLDVTHMRQAIAEERARLPLQDVIEEPAVNAFGPAALGVQRTVRGAPAAVLSQLEVLLAKVDLLVPVRRTGDRLILEPRRDPVGNLARALVGGGRRLDLVRVDHLVVTATAVDEQRTVLRFDAVLTTARRLERRVAIGVSALLAMLALWVSIPLFVFSLVVPAFATTVAVVLGALAAGGGWLTWRAAKRRYRTLLGRAQMRLEALLDDAEIGRLEAPVGLLGKLLG